MLFNVIQRYHGANGHLIKISLLFQKSVFLTREPELVIEINFVI